MKYLFFILIVLGMSSFVAPFSQATEGENPYKGCCGTAPVYTMIGEERVFIPNLFTPNRDGLNDLFKPFYNAEKVKLVHFFIKNDLGKVIWSNEKYDPSDVFSAWTGRVSADSTYVGLFHYSMLFEGEGASANIEGSACSAICHPKIPVEISEKNNCFFPMQYPRDSFEYKSVWYLEADCLK
jgi:hypothetical protein